MDHSLYIVVGLKDCDQGFLSLSLTMTSSAGIILNLNHITGKKMDFGVGGGVPAFLRE